MDPIGSFEDSSMETVLLHSAESLVEPPDQLNEYLNELKSQEQQTKLSSPIMHGNKVSSCMSNFCGVVKDLKVEMLMFLYMFSYSIRSVSSTSMILEKVCLAHLGYSQAICSNVSQDESIKVLTEKMTTNYNLGHALIQMVPSIFLGLFLGAWSDKYGRKLPIIISLIGIIIDGLGSTICAVIMNSRVEYYFIPAIFTGFSGGIITVLTVLYSYASDISSMKNRTMKYAILEVTFGLALPLGAAAGGWIFRYYGYVPVFMISTTGHVLALVWVIFFLKETRGLDSNDTWREKFLNFWSSKSIVESFMTAVKRRPNQGREQILLLTMSMSVAVLNVAAASSINFLYVHHVYNWGNTKYSTVQSIFSVMGTVCLLISVPIFKRLKLGDAALGTVGSLSILLKSIALGLSVNEHIYYLGFSVGSFGGLASLAGRSRISKVTSKEDLGKVFAFVSSAESILPIIAATVTSLIFEATLEVFPGTTYFILGVPMLSSIFVFIWLGRLSFDESECEKNDAQEEKTQNPTYVDNKEENIEIKKDYVSTSETKENFHHSSTKY